MFISKDVFDAAVKNTRLQEKAAAMAFRVLVLGQSAASAGRAEGASRQAAAAAAAKVRAAMMRELQSDWQISTISASPEMKELCEAVSERQRMRQGLATHAKMPNLTPEIAADLAEILTRWREKNGIK